MFDFVSTREGVEPTTQAAARLIAACIAETLRDAATPIDPEEAVAGRNYNYTALQAIEYLFDPDSDFDEHVHLIGGSAAVVRSGLLSSRELPARGLFTSEMRTVIQARYAWWLAQSHRTQLLLETAP